MESNLHLWNQFGRLTASFVPPMLRRQFAATPKRNLGVELIGDHAALLWVDICDFSPMANRLMLDRVRGVERLSGILQDHFEPLLTIIARFGGEPVSFAGDSVLAAWPCSADNLRLATENALACAQAVSAAKAVFDDQRQPISLHLVVAAGTCQLIELGGVNGHWTFTLLGEALDDLRLTARNRAPNKVLLSKNTCTVLGPDVQSIAVEHGAVILSATVQMEHYPTSDDPPLLPEAYESLKAYIPQSVAFRLDQERLNWIAELRPVTIVFVQLQNFTPETSDAAECLQRTVEIAMSIVLRDDGLLNQVWIDEKAANLLICFGPPPTEHNDNPVRGLQTAVALQTALQKKGFRNSIGVTTGRGFCGLLGNDVLRQYTVIGDVVNLAARLAGLSKDCVNCDEATMRAASNAFEFNDSQRITVKGRVEQIAVWEPKRATPFKRNQQLLLPMVGREKELNMFLDALNDIATGNRTAFVVEGESGLGKSRLLTEFKDRAVTMSCRVLVSTGDWVERGVLYQAWRSIFSALFELDSLISKEAKEAAVMKAIGAENLERACLLNILLPLEFAVSQTVQALSGQQRSAATHEFLVQLIRQAAETKRLVILIDNAQWIDDASWALAADVVSTVSGCLLVCTIQQLDGSGDASLLIEKGAIHHRLNEFADDELDRLLCAKLGVGQVSVELTMLVRNLAKGNALFCLELIQSLLDEGVIKVQDGICQITAGIITDRLQLPETIQGIVRRRIDSLKPGPELALKVASVAGQRFASRLINIFTPSTANGNKFLPI